MSYALATGKANGILTAETEGVRTRESLMAMAKEIMDTCVEEQTPKVLVDVRKLEGRLPIPDMIQVVLYFRKIRRPAHVKKAAIVDLKKNEIRHKMFEYAARIHGYNLAVFNDTGKAATWLNEPVSS